MASFTAMNSSSHSLRDSQQNSHTGAIGQRFSGSKYPSPYESRNDPSRKQSISNAPSDGFGNAKRHQVNYLFLILLFFKSYYIELQLIFALNVLSSFI